MWVSAKLHVVQFKAPLPRVWSFKRMQEILELNSSAGVLRPLDYLPKTSKHNQMFNVVQYNLPSNKFPLWCAANRNFRDSSVSSLLSCAVRSESLRNCSLLIHLDPPGSTDAIWCWLFHLSVDQNKKVSQAATIADQPRQPRSQRCQSRKGSVVSNIILRRESSKHCYAATYHSI